MKTSTTPTNTIAIAARNNSEWDNCDFVILSLSDNFIEQLSARLAALNTVKALEDFAGLRFWDNPAGWFVNNEDVTEDLQSILTQQEWTYVELSDEEKEALTPTEQNIQGEHMRIHSDGSFCFIGHGKHTGEEFWTSDVPCAKIIENHKPSLVTAE